MEDYEYGFNSTIGINPCKVCVFNVVHISLTGKCDVSGLICQLSVV